MLKMLLVQREKVIHIYFSNRLRCTHCHSLSQGIGARGEGVGCPGGGRRPNDNGGLIAATSTEQIKLHGAPIIGL